MVSNMDYVGFQFDRQSIAAVAQEITRQQKAKRDFVFRAKDLRFTDSGEIVLPDSVKAFVVDGITYTTWEDAEEASDKANYAGRPSRIGFATSPVFKLNSTATSQLATRLDVPGRFVTKLHSKGYDDIIGSLFSGLLGKSDRRFLLRTLDGVGRAVLSDRYRLLDNADLFFASVETFKEVGAEAWKARLWENGFELFAVAPHISGEVTLDRTFDPGDGWRSRWHGESGDAHNAAMRISNSETGTGGLNVNFSIMRKICANFCVWTEGVSQVHLGKQNSGDGVLYSESTREQEGQLVWSKVKDCIRTGFDEKRFKAYIDELNQATTRPVEDPVTAVTNIVKAYEMTEANKNAILQEFLSSGDRSQFGLCQAVTAASHGLDAGLSYESASNLEEIGTNIVRMGEKEFYSLVASS